MMPRRQPQRGLEPTNLPIAYLALLMLFEADRHGLRTSRPRRRGLFRSCHAAPSEGVLACELAIRLARLRWRNRVNFLSQPRHFPQ